MLSFESFIINMISFVIQMRNAVTAGLIMLQLEACHLIFVLQLN